MRGKLFGNSLGGGGGVRYVSDVNGAYTMTLSRIGEEHYAAYFSSSSIRPLNNCLLFTRLALYVGSYPRGLMETAKSIMDEGLYSGKQTGSGLS